GYAELELRRRARRLADRDRARADGRLRPLPVGGPPDGEGRMNIAASKGGIWALKGYFAALVVFLYIPLIVLVVFSFDNSTIQTLPYSGFTTKWFHAAFSNVDLTSSMERSAVIGVLCAFGATLLGLIAAVGLTAQRMRLRGLITALVLLPLVVPYIVLAVG